MSGPWIAWPLYSDLFGKFELHSPRFPFLWNCEGEVLSSALTCGGGKSSCPDGMRGQRFRFVVCNVSVLGGSPLETVMHGMKGFGASVLLFGGTAVTRMRGAAATVPTMGRDSLWHAFTPST